MIYYKSSQFELILSKFESKPHPSKSGYGTILKVISWAETREKPKVGQQLTLLKYGCRGTVEEPVTILKEVL